MLQRTLCANANATCDGAHVQKKVVTEKSCNRTKFVRCACIRTHGGGLPGGSCASHVSTCPVPCRHARDARCAPPPATCPPHLRSPAPWPLDGLACCTDSPRRVQAPPWEACALRPPTAGLPPDARLPCTLSTVDSMCRAAARFCYAVVVMDVRPPKMACFSLQSAILLGCSSSARAIDGKPMMPRDAAVESVTSSLGSDAPAFLRAKVQPHTQLLALVVASVVSWL